MTKRAGIPEEPRQATLEGVFLFRWLQKLWRHIRGDSAWIEPTLLNGWVRYSAAGGGYPTAQYRIKGGVVYIEGLVKNGTTTPGAVIFSLPEGYIPKQQVIIASLSNNALGRFDIRENGDVTFQLGVSVWLSLTCSFVAEQ